MQLEHSFIADIKRIIEQSRDVAIRSVDFARVQMYWHIGERIFVEEQQGKERADYGVYLTKLVSEQLQPEFSSGFSVRQIELIRQFYRTFPIANAQKNKTLKIRPSEFCCAPTKMIRL